MSSQDQGSITHRNLAENASAGYLGLLGSVKPFDVNFIKLRRRISYLIGRERIQHSLLVRIGANGGSWCPIYSVDFGNIGVGRYHLQNNLLSSQN
jgi:hypothetical protein